MRVWSVFLSSAVCAHARVETTAVAFTPNIAGEALATAKDSSAASSEDSNAESRATPAAEASSVPQLSASTSASLQRKVYSYDGDDYPGADGGVIVALPQRVVGTVEPFEWTTTTSASDGSSHTPAPSSEGWPVPHAVPYYEWMMAQARGNRFALPEQAQQLLEQLEKTLSDYANGRVHEVLVERRRLQVDAVLNLLNNAQVSNDEHSLGFNPQQFPTLVNAISGSVNNVVQAAGEAVGVTTTTSAPVNQAVLGLLSILQGFQKLAVAAGSMGKNLQMT